jgi:membrane protein implicated in regulation of membrane protease activity
LGNMLSGFNGLETFFLVCAGIGGFFVLVRVVLQLAGGGSDTNIDDGSNIDIHHTDSDMGFRLLSLHGLTSFLMMFGLVGLAMYHQSKAGLLSSLVGALIAGLATVWVIGKLFRLAGRMQSSGTLRTDCAFGSLGTVYLKIPKGGTGLVSISFQNRLREFDAVEINGEELQTGTPVQVVQVNGKVLVVEAINNIPENGQ